jgi:tetratricopeptide (TPR) repeat protein
MPLMVIVTYRPAELLLTKNQFTQIKLNLQARRVCHEISLEFLSLNDIENYLSLEFPKHRFGKELAEIIHARTEGSPLFMVDLIHDLRDRKVIANLQGYWGLQQAVPEIQSDLPESIRSMIHRKIDQLDETDFKLMVTASVQGQEFDSAIVSKVLDRDPAGVEERLEELDSVHAFVRKVREYEFPDATLSTRYAFVHILYQNALYDSFSPTRKASLSLSVARTLEGCFREKSAGIALDLAFLYEAGRDFEKSADYFLLAAQNEVRVFANQEAVLLLRRTIANAEKLQGEERYSRTLKASLRSGQVHQTMGRFEDAVADFEAAEKVAAEADNPEGQIKALCAMAMAFFYTKQLPMVQEHGRRALKLANAVESSVGVPSAEIVLACERMGVGDIDAAVKYFDPAIPVLKKKGSPVEVIPPISFRGLIHNWSCEYEQAHQMINWALEQARESGNILQVLQCHFALSMALGNQGRVSDAMGIVKEGMNLAELNNERLFMTRFPNILGWIYRELQDFETALHLDTESVKLCQEFGEFHAEANARINLSHDCLVLGELESAYSHLQRAQQLVQQGVWMNWRFNIRLQAEMASYWLAREDLNRAASCAAALLKGAEKTTARKYIAWAHKLLGDIAVLEDRIEDGNNHYETALSTVHFHPCPALEWKILKASAELAGQLKDEPRSEALLGRSRTVIQTLADSVTDEELRRKFLSSKNIRNI